MRLTAVQIYPPGTVFFARVQLVRRRASYPDQVGQGGPVIRRHEISDDQWNRMGVTTAFHLPSDGACTGFSML